MFKLWLANTVWQRITDLENYLIDELKLSEVAALQRTNRMRLFLEKINQTIIYPLCRFRPWFELGYRCILFEKSWVFAYEVFEGGIIIRDMSHTALLKNVT